MADEERLKLLAVSVVSAWMPVMQAMTMRANITAYSTAVGGLTKPPAREITGASPNPGLTVGRQRGNHGSKAASSR